jgi:carboxypeptidase family protein
MEQSVNIDRLRIATPCPVGWEQMTGDDRVRFCDHCQLNVYNISALSTLEAETLIASTEGRICARLFRRADGTILTKDCPVGLRVLRLRVSKKAAAVFAAVIGLAGAAFGQQSPGKDEKAGCRPQIKLTRKSAASDPLAKTISGTVVDPVGAAIPGAKVTFTNHATKEAQQTNTNDAGRFEFSSVTAGDYSISVEMPSFKALEVKNVVLEKDQLLDLDLILEPSQAIEVVGLLMEAPSLIETPAPGTMIINEKMIRRLPIPK